MTDKEFQTLKAEVNLIKREVSSLAETMKTMQEDINSRVRLSDLSRSEEALRLLIRDNSLDISKLDQKLSKIILPEETRFYLKEGEIDIFQSNFSKLLALMSKFEKLYNNLVSYSVRVSAES